MPPEDTKPPSLSPSQEVKQDHIDEDEENATPGVVWVPGMTSSDSTGNQEVEIEANQAESTRMILEAQLVVEEDTERVAQQERERIEEEMRQKVIREIGQVAQAEVVEDDGTNTRRRALLCAGIVVILLAIILGIVYGTRDTSVEATAAPSFRSSASPSMAPLNNSLCEEAHNIDLGGDTIRASLASATKQLVVSCEFPEQDPDSQPGLWYKVRGSQGSFLCGTLILILTSRLLPIFSSLAKASPLLPKQVATSIFRSIQLVIKPATLPTLFT
jgi:hypothetical protein